MMEDDMWFTASVGWREQLDDWNFDWDSLDNKDNEVE